MRRTTATRRAFAASSSATTASCSKGGACAAVVRTCGLCPHVRRRCRPGTVAMWERPLGRVQRRPPRVAVHALQMLDAIDVGARLGEADSLSRLEPPVDVPLPGVVRGERGPLVPVPVLEMAEVPG